MAAFAPGEPFDFSALESRAFLTLGLPEEEGWGLFDAVDPNLTLTIHITDTQNRLGSIRVYELERASCLDNPCATSAAERGGNLLFGSSGYPPWTMSLQLPKGLRTTRTVRANPPFPP